MKNKLLTLYLLFFAVHLCAQKINGISFVASRDSLKVDYIKPVLDVHANYIALMPFGFIRDLSSPEVRFNSKWQWFGEKVSGIHQYAIGFQKHNVKIMLKPQIWVYKGEYTGFIEMDNDENWKTLEKTYEAFILTYAKVAQEINTDILCIGTELEKFVSNRPKYWKELIQKIKKVYKGKLTYAANWDEFKRVSFWDELDYIGIDAYFPITNFKSPSVSDYEKGWVLHKEQIEKVQKQVKKPVLFTEFGYRSVNYSGKEPWDSKRIIGDVNFEAQLNGLQAVYNQFWKEDWFAGGFVWKWFMNHDRAGGLKDNRFTPQNKPAEALLAKLYKE